MKKILSLFFLVLSFLTYANTSPKKISKTYSEEEFIKKVSEEVRNKIDSIKNKSISDLTKEILEKEEQLKLRELELQKHLDSFKVTEEELGKKYAEFSEKQKTFIACIDKNEEESKSRITQLVEMISNMKPQKAAEILSVQESEIAVRIIQAIDSKKASKIFNFMDKDISAKLQKQYLEMKK